MESDEMYVEKRKTEESYIFGDSFILPTHFDFKDLSQ